MSPNVTQTISSPQQPTQRVLLNPSPQVEQGKPEEAECWKICRDRFKYVILFNIFIQYLLIFIYSILLNISVLYPSTCIKEMFVVLCSPMMLVTVVHGYFKLKPLIT